MGKTTQNHIIILTLFLVTTALITVFLPSKNFQGFSYTLGKPWAHAILKAPFDIPIELDSAAARHVTDSINQNTAKIYRKDYNLINKQLNKLDVALNKQAGIDAATRKTILAKVHKLYEDGIVENDVYDQITQGHIKEVRILGNKVADVTSTSKMNSAREAYTMLDTMLTGSKYHAAMSAVAIYNYLKPDLAYDSIESQKLIDDALQKALAPRGVVQTGESIIFPGNIVTAEKFAILQSYDRMMKERQMHSQGINYGILGQFCFVAIMMLVSYIFLRVIRPRTFRNLRKMVFVISFIALFIIVVELVTGFRANYISLIPFAIVPIILTTFCDSRTSFFLHMVVVILCSLVAKDQAEFIVMQFLAGNIAIISIREMSRRSQLAQCAFYIFLTYSIMDMTFRVLREGNLSNAFADPGWWHVFLMFAINCAVLSFAYILIFVIEKIFGFTSTVTLVELSDITSPELRALSESCPGTFQHSLQVANLAAEAAHEIGANAQLARAGALYHDIGKINNPAFFTENQMGVNPHDSLTPDQSARIVIDHVADGLKRADKARLPQVIKDFVAQHHGKSRTKFFYTMACKAHPDQVIDPAPYTYPGPNPLSKEAAIVMMADSCEAAAKSLTHPSEKDISNLVERIINGQISDGLLSEAPISFIDIGIIKQTFIERLRTFYHMRVSYPEDIKPIAQVNDTDDDIDESPTH